MADYTELPMRFLLKSRFFKKFDFLFLHASSRNKKKVTVDKLEEKC